MSELEEAFTRVTESDVFQEWNKTNAKAYLCSFFRILGQDETPGWQVDFYNPKSDTMSSFVAGSEVEMVGKDSKIFKEKDVKVDKLNLKNVSVGVHEVLNTVSLVKNEKYAQEVPTKQILILQNFNGYTWNISYVTQSLNILNVKVDAESGKVIEETLKPILSFRA